MKNILIIRRDNIGDLVCTTPLIEGVKIAYPDAKLYLLINKVSQDVVKHNPHLEKVFVYKKAKHKAKNETTLGVYFQRLMMLWQLRKIKFDAVILANPEPCKYSLRMAKMIGAKKIIGADLGTSDIHHPFKSANFHGKHQVERTFSYLSAITDKVIPIPPVRVYLTDEERHIARQRLKALLPASSGHLYAVHFSNRRVKSSWPLERYAEIIRHLTTDHHASVLIFWSPPGTLAPDDIGDDKRAEQLLMQCQNPRVALYPTASVRELLAAFDLCDLVLCSDGGQMHLAAALNKKQVVFFGETKPEEWHPWSDDYQIIQATSGNCADIPVEEVWQKMQQLK
ncbi:glycosyltransferase family 9 protein [Serratia sp. DD3]|uniref:glycosyltransferase family 9 protein n=1 Tax=Serratia sp. DD3 TaxID=1410619 RepID=UPI0004DACA2E|nr:glycosyltransferase family 9 protein [Serratia sp. DD3]KEY56517.1 lipopolysaccharide core heptosyltransferase RfaQ [Serratia sp. DD3]KEY56737.1 lipopolysaccharide core heptosyltransferase RfaQ [Serratia sp. DD3]KEY58330.1 lipopolysaccharide core heptosyltransferase RfaQ [Serratia sp. DD3]KEY59448.1 lipopolysaccharide core heptosyltransferase RfaQ [Serratia sp. DD3]